MDRYSTDSIPVSATINLFKINTYHSLVGHDWPPILGPFCGVAPTHRLLIEVTITITFLVRLPKGQLMNSNEQKPLKSWLLSPEDLDKLAIPRAW